MDIKEANKIIDKAENQSKDLFNILAKNALYNQEKVLNAFTKNRVNATHFIRVRAMDTTIWAETR